MSDLVNPAGASIAPVPQQPSPDPKKPPEKPPEGLFSTAFRVLEGVREELTKQAKGYYNAIDNQIKLAEDSESYLEKIEGIIEGNPTYPVKLDRTILKFLASTSVMKGKSAEDKNLLEKAKDATSIMDELDVKQKAIKSFNETKLQRLKSPDYLEYQNIVNGLEAEKSTLVKDCNKVNSFEKADLQRISEKLRNFNSAQTDFSATANLKIQGIMQKYNTINTWLTNMHSLLFDINKQILRALG